MPRVDAAGARGQYQPQHQPHLWPKTEGMPNGAVLPGVTVTALLYILVVGGLCLASVDLVGAIVDRRRDPSWWLQLLRGLGTIALVVALLVWPGETLGVVRLIAAVLLLLWGASTLGEAYQSPIRDDPRGYRGQLDKEIPHRLI